MAKMPSILIGLMGKGSAPKEAESSPDVSADDDVKEALAAEFLSAVESKDAKAVAEAFEAMYQHCKDSGYASSMGMKAAEKA